MRIELQMLGLDQGGDLLLRRALRRLPEGEQLEVAGSHAELTLQLRSWARAMGHRFEVANSAAGAVGMLNAAPWSQRVTTERAGTAALDGIVEHPPSHWGLAGRSAEVEPGGPACDFTLIDKLEVWADDAARLYARATAAQWDPNTAIDWSAPIEHDAEIEDAVVQIMTYLIENETAALMVPARFLARLHPHFREVMQLLAMQAAEE